MKSNEGTRRSLMKSCIALPVQDRLTNRWTQGGVVDMEWHPAREMSGGEPDSSDEQDTSAVDMSVDDGVERMTGEGGVATEIPHKRLRNPMSPSDSGSSLT